MPMSSLDRGGGWHLWEIFSWELESRQKAFTSSCAGGHYQALCPKGDFCLYRANSPPKSPPNGVRSRATGITTPRPASSVPTPPKQAFWAGPGYVVSPKPDALPIPPMSLLQRA